MPWYLFTPPAIGTRDPSDPNQYTLVGNTPPTCIGNTRMCALQAQDLNQRPIITTALFREIIRALENRTASTNVLLKD